MSSQGHSQSSSKRAGFFSSSLKSLLLCGFTVTVYNHSLRIPYLYKISINIIIQYGSNCILGIVEVWGFQSINIAQKPASNFLFNSLAALVRHSQAQKCLQINSKFFQQVVMKF